MSIRSRPPRSTLGAERTTPPAARHTPSRACDLLIAALDPRTKPVKTGVESALREASLVEARANMGLEPRGDDDAPI